MSLKGTVKNVTGKFFFVEVEGQPKNVFCLPSQVEPEEDWDKIKSNSSVEIDAIETGPKGSRAKGKVKILSAGAGKAEGKTKAKSDTSSKPEHSSGLGVTVSYGKLQHVESWNMDRLPVIVTILSGNKPAMDYKVELKQTFDQVIDPAPELYTNRDGKVTFYASVQPDEETIEFLATVYLPNGQKRQYSEEWCRSEKEKVEPAEFVVTKQATKNAYTWFKFKHSPNAQVKIKADRGVVWGYVNSTEKKTQMDAVQLDDKGEADILMISSDSDGMMIKFSSDKSESSNMWLYGNLEEEPVAGTELVKKS